MLSYSHTVSCKELNIILTKAQEQCVHTHGIDIKKAMCNHVGSKNHRLKESIGCHQWIILPQFTLHDCCPL